MAVDTHLHPGGQRIEVALTTHRAALPHCQLLVAALDARGTCIGRGPQVTRPWTVPACGRGPLRPWRYPRRHLRPRRACAVSLSCEHSRDVGPIALCLASSGRCLGALAKEQGPKSFRTEFGSLKGEHHIKIHANTHSTRP